MKTYRREKSILGWTFGICKSRVGKVGRFSVLELSEC